MGFTPQQVDAMTFWEFAAAVNGWTKVNCPDTDTASSLSEDEHDKLMAKY